MFEIVLFLGLLLQFCQPFQDLLKGAAARSLHLNAARCPALPAAIKLNISNSLFQSVEAASGVRVVHRRHQMMSTLKIETLPVPDSHAAATAAELVLELTLQIRGQLAALFLDHLVEFHQVFVF